MWLASTEDKKNGGVFWRVLGGDETTIREAVASTSPETHNGHNGDHHIEPSVARALLEGGMAETVRDGGDA